MQSLNENLLLPLKQTVYGMPSFLNISLAFVCLGISLLEVTVIDVHQQIILAHVLLMPVIEIVHLFCDEPLGSRKT